MQRSASVGEGRCEAHEFRLYPFSEAIYNGQYYNERVGRRPSKAHRQAKNLTFPRFNRDNNFSTPAFILNSERNYYQSEGNKMRIEHERKMEDYTQEKLEINIAKPRSKNNYCSVCKGSYEDYLDHITSEHHRRRIHHSSFNRDILELGMRYQKENRKRRTKGALEKNLSTRIEDSDEVQIISNPYKIVKPNEREQDPPAAHSRNPYMGGLHCGEGTGQAGLGMVPALPSTFKPFSTTYQQQMSQFILNLNIFLNPYPMVPQVGLMGPSPADLALQAKQQQLSMLQYSLLNQISCSQVQQMQMQLQMQMAPQMHPHSHGPLIHAHPHQHPQSIPIPPSRGPTVIVIDE